ncbi:MAG TPA: ABC transporter ATP-binding protein [Spirochaetia bacterium]|nr:ABC transporter ATP-binding protein [Spirochaetia bacterium]
MIELVEVTRHYEMGETLVRALDGVSLRIGSGEYVSVVGPSGSGKSTLMNLIGCLDVPTSGDYLLAGENVAGLSRDRLAEVRNRRIGFVFQSFNLLPRVSALENVELPLVYSGLSRRKRREAALEMLDRVALGDRAHHVPNELSGGQRQRVAIARALAGSPSVLLADEPTGALDTKTGVEIMALFRELNESGVTLVVVTHDPDVARQADRVVQVRDGKVLQDVPAKEWVA